MKKNIIICFTILLYVSLVISCKQKSSVQSISVSGEKTEFIINEKFSPGKDFVLKVRFSDGQEKDRKAGKCTFYIENEEIKKYKFTEIGTYEIVVKYEQIACSYNVVVHEGKSAITFLLVIKIILSVVAIFIFIIIIKKIKRSHDLKEEDERKRKKEEKERDRKKEIAKRKEDERRKRKEAARRKQIKDSKQQLIEAKKGKTSQETVCAKCGRGIGTSIAKFIAKENHLKVNFNYEKETGKLFNSSEFKKLVPNEIIHDFRNIVYTSNKVLHPEGREKPLNLNESQIAEIIGKAENIINWFEKEYCS